MACHTQSGLIGSASIIVVAPKRRRDARVAGPGCGDHISSSDDMDPCCAN
jgi:hypothetical protein